MYVNPTKESAPSRLAKVSDVFAALRSETLQARDVASLPRLERRQFGYGYGSGYGYGGNSNWYNYGRWILLGVIVAAAVLIWLIVCGCNRRRTRAGNQPVKYTGWATPGFQHPQQSGVAPMQPYTASSQQYPMQNYGGQQQYPVHQQGNYSGAGYQPQQGYQPTQQQQGAGFGGHSEYTAPPSYPATNTPTYPDNVAPRDK